MYFFILATRQILRAHANKHILGLALYSVFLNMTFKNVEHSNLWNLFMFAEQTQCLQLHCAKLSAIYTNKKRFTICIYEQLSDLTACCWSDTV